jgi:hypothetical protein
MYDISMNTISAVVNHKHKTITINQFPGGLLDAAMGILGWQGGTVWQAMDALKEKGWEINQENKLTSV